MAKSDLTPNAQFPWIWEHTTPVANQGCGGCPMSGLSGHKSCVAFKFGDTGPNTDQRLSLPDLRAMQYEVMRKERDAIGWFGSQPGFLYNARDSYNYSDAVGATIVSASGNLLTVDFGEADPRNVTLYAARRRAESDIGLTFWVPGYGGFGVVQPGDGVEYGGNSILHAKSRPTVKEIVSCSGSQVTYRLDQDCSNAMVPVDPDDPNTTFTVGFWNQAGNPEDWLHIQHPTYLKGKRKRRVIDVSSLPANKIHTLSSKAVAHPPGFLGDVFVIEGWDAENEEWVRIGDDADRLFTRTFADGTYDAVVSLGSQKPDYANEPEEALTDLTSTWQSLRITFYEESADGCKSQCYKRCKHAKIDYTRSIANYGAPNGVGVDADGLHWYCSARKYPVFVLSDLYDRLSQWPDIIPGEDGIMDTVTIEWRTASGVENFPQSGQCLQYGTCDMFEPSENDQDNNAIWRYEYHAGRALRDLWGACNTRIRQHLPGYSQSWNFTVERIKHAGLQWLAFLDLDTPIGLHPKMQFVGVGTWGTAVGTRTDGNNVYIEDKWAHNYDDDLSDGHYPAEVSNFKPSRDPIDSDGTVSLNEIERLGIRNLRDDGAITGRGLHAWSKLLPNGQFIVPNCLNTLTGEVQDKQTSLFERYASPHDVFGNGSFMAGACITIKPLRQDAKSPEGIGSRTIHAASVEGNVITLELENEPHTWSYIMTLEAGNSFDKLVTWYGGGAPPFYPEDPKLIDSYYETDKSMGSPYGGVQPGDSAGISISGFEDWRFVLSQATPFGGSEAPTWGTLSVASNTFEVGGFFSPASANTSLGGFDTLPDGTIVEEHGVMTAPDSGDWVAAGATVYTGVPGDTRPATLSADTFWFDEAGNRLYFSAANNGTTVTVRYGVDGKSGTFTESYTIQTQPVVSTGISWADWTGADSTSVTYVEDGTAVTGYTASDNAGTLEMQFSGDDAGKQINVRAQKGVEAEEPDDGVTIINYGYTAEGKKRDLCKLVDESGLLASRIGELPGKTISFYYVDWVYWPTSLTVQYTAYGQDAWTTLTAGSDYVSQHGTGKIWLSEAFLSGKPEAICFKL